MPFFTGESMNPTAAPHTNPDIAKIIPVDVFITICLLKNLIKSKCVRSTKPHALTQRNKKKKGKRKEKE